MSNEEKKLTNETNIKSWTPSVFAVFSLVFQCVCRLLFVKLLWNCRMLRSRFSSCPGVLPEFDCCFGLCDTLFLDVEEALVVGRRLFCGILVHEQDRRIHERSSLAFGGACLVYILDQIVLSMFPLQKSSAFPDLFYHFITACMSYSFCCSYRLSECFLCFLTCLVGFCLSLVSMMRPHFLLLLLLSSPVFLASLPHQSSLIRL